jgi:adenine-specific DNA-methyltransferase
MPEYIKIAKERIGLAEKGELRIRPMERSVYEPNGSVKNIPPRYVEVGDLLQVRLLESREDYKKRKNDESSI